MIPLDLIKRLNQVPTGNTAKDFPAWARWIIRACNFLISLIDSPTIFQNCSSDTHRHIRRTSLKSWSIWWGIDITSVNTFPCPSKWEAALSSRECAGDAWGVIPGSCPQDTVSHSINGISCNLYVVCFLHSASFATTRILTLRLGIFASSVLLHHMVLTMLTETCLGRSGPTMLGSKERKWV